MADSPSSKRISGLVKNCESCRVLAAEILGRLNRIEGRFLVGTEQSCYVAGVTLHDLRRELEDGIRG
jgi:hypothetical protein